MENYEPIKALLALLMILILLGTWGLSMLGSAIDDLKEIVEEMEGDE